MAMTLKERIDEDMKVAMRARDTVRLDVIRLLKAAVQRKEVDERCELDEQGVEQVIQKLLKQSQEAAEQFTRGGRRDLADKEHQSVDILQAYLPEQLSESEVAQAVSEAIAESNAKSMKDIGRVMALVKEQTQGRVDMKLVSEKVKTLLQ
ncbi:MAG: GatB/YqeY domain-containing protein [Gammaproteobacteria bacterium]|nr:GatB/YqeY domain-containing protein [Gammaproteobacteria bacterium]